MEIRAYTEYNEAEILGLYASVGWTAYTDDPSALRNGFANSLLTLAAYEEAALAGLIRVVGDGHTIVFVQDILVRPQFQRRGIGPALFAGSLFHDKTKPVSGFLAYDGGPQVFLRPAVNTNEKRNHEICFIIVSSRRFCVSI